MRIFAGLGPRVHFRPDARIMQRTIPETTMSVDNEPISLDVLASLCRQTLQETRATRKEVADVRTLSLQTIDYARRIERRVAEQRDDLELMLKAELGGALANMQSQLEGHLQPIEDRLRGLDELERRVDALEPKP
ncbi:hypothetical protein D4Q52_23260 [Rhodopseudomonas palustris]|uniref:Uncharacterized protein n=2 Tax=Rhodopseudomonas palustris TaxID=1076 RepID=A0A418UY74_RHOPL|nr:hypothetical protein D4Q52_23260 [Rhodopseudomonas palustris]